MTNEKIKIITYSESDDLPFLIKKGELLSFLFLGLIAFLDELTGVKMIWSTLLFFLLIIYMGFATYVKQLSSTIIIDLLKEEMTIKVLFRVKHRFNIKEGSLSIEYSKKSNDMEYCLNSLGGKHFIPQGYFMNSTNKVKSVINVFQKYGNIENDTFDKKINN